MEPKLLHEILEIDRNTYELAEAIASISPDIIKELEESPIPLRAAYEMYISVLSEILAMNDSKERLRWQFKIMPHVFNGYISICELLVAKEES